MCKQNILSIIAGSDKAVSIVSGMLLAGQNVWQNVWTQLDIARYW